ncbi:unnamed protein product [Protopolystoma xenopodis]|uniref:Uncharacterized protein n=1 Tax=Protopolystoma xenopodis TaxID=117903 RepID=A0A448WNN9_9PLAT|nr:unnamed protein product [Protopolystoma xenopodis]
MSPDPPEIAKDSTTIGAWSNYNHSSAKCNRTVAETLEQISMDRFHSQPIENSNSNLRSKESLLLSLQSPNTSQFWMEGIECAEQLGLPKPIVVDLNLTKEKCDQLYKKIRRRQSDSHGESELLGTEGQGSSKQFIVVGSPVLDETSAEVESLPNKNTGDGSYNSLNHDLEDESRTRMNFILTSMDCPITLPPPPPQTPSLSLSQMLLLSPPTTSPVLSLPYPPEPFPALETASSTIPALLSPVLGDRNDSFSRNRSAFSKALHSSSLVISRPPENELLSRWVNTKAINNLYNYVGLLIRQR